MLNKLHVVAVTKPATPFCYGLYLITLRSCDQVKQIQNPYLEYFAQPPNYI